MTLGLRSLSLISLGTVGVACHPAPSSPPPERSPSLGGTTAVASEADRIVEVVAGTESTCARTKAGRVACVGQAVAYSEERPSIDTHEPQVIDVPPSKAISAGTRFACSVDRDGGKVRCWGDNEWGQLGRKTPSHFDHWPLAVPNLEGVEQITSLGNTTCARTGRQVSCWPGSGEDQAPSEFELEEDEAPSGLQPRVEGEYDQRANLRFGRHPVPGDAPALDAISRRDYSLDLQHPWDSADAVWCGLGEEAGLARCGHSYGGPSLTFEVAADMELGLQHGCAAADGGVVCRGANVAGQAPPDPVQLAETVTDIAVGAEHSCAVTVGGNLYCWGSSMRGQLGLPSAGPRPPRVVAKDVKRSWATRALTCVERIDGEFRCTGPQKDPCAMPTFSPIRGPTNIAQTIEVDDYTGCGVDGQGLLWCLDTGAWRNRGPAGSPGGSLPEREQFTADSARDLCWLENGVPWCADRTAPEYVGPGGGEPTRTLGPPERPFGRREGFVRLEVVDDDLCAVGGNGKLACVRWMENPRADEKKTGPWVDVEVPTQKVTQLTGDTLVFEDGTANLIYSHEFRRQDGTKYPALEGGQLSASEAHQGVKQAAGHCVLLESGELFCGNENAPWVPDTRFTSLVGSDQHACAIDDKRQLWCWGAGAYGQLGDGRPACSRTPQDLTPSFRAAWEAAR